MVADDLRETLFAARLTNKLKFTGFENSEELILSALELFTGSKNKLSISHVSGTTEEFQADIDADLTNENEMDELIKLYMRNTDETLKLSYKR